MRTILILSFIIACQSTMNAQIFGKISEALDDSFNKISDKIAQSMLEKFIEKTLNGEPASADSLEHYTVDTTSNKSKSDLSSIFGSSSKKKIDKKFNFDYNVEMQITNDENTNVVLYYMPSQGTYVGMEMSSVIAIVDFESEESYTIVNGSLVSFNMSKMFDRMSQEAYYDQGNYSVTKTGRTERIVDRLCEEYIIKSDEYSSEVWISNEFINSDLRSSTGIERIINNKAENDISGFAMRVISTDEKGEKTTMEVTSITAKQRVIDLSQY